MSNKKEIESSKLPESSNNGNDYHLLSGISINLQNSNLTSTKCLSIDFSSAHLNPIILDFKLYQLVQTKLQVLILNLSCNQLVNAPFNLRHFTNLNTLDVSKNLLTNLSLIINNLTSLRILIACDNKLNQDSFPKVLNSNFSHQLKVLNLSGNQFHSLPEQLFNFSQLQSLYMGGNKINIISKNIAKLNQLRFLYLGGNQLKEIPLEVGFLANLEVLSLCDNQLTKLPSSIYQLTKLKTLSLRKNQLTTLPTAIVRLASLKEVSVYIKMCFNFIF